jgi:hypothetical protein
LLYALRWTVSVERWSVGVFPADEQRPAERNGTDPAPPPS